MSGISADFLTTSPVRVSTTMSTRSYATPYESASTISLSPEPSEFGRRTWIREWLWPATTTSTAELIWRASSMISPT